jgi:MFS family permease
MVGASVATSPIIGETMLRLDAASSTIGEMIFWRALQGFIGGGMIPTVFASAFTIFPASG